jgi:Bacterial membrane protein YfhO
LAQTLRRTSEPDQPTGTSRVDPSSSLGNGSGAVRLPVAVATAMLVLLVISTHGLPLALGLTWWPVPSIIGGDPARGPRYPAAVDEYSFPHVDWPWRVVEADQVRQGRLPLWNPYSSLGLPFPAEYQNQVFFPLEWVEMFGGPTLWGLLLLVKMTLAGIGTYLLLRRLVDSDLAALAGAVLYTFSGYFLWLYTVTAFVNGAMLVPWLFLGILLLAAERRRVLAGCALTSLSVGLQFLAGQPQIAFISLVGASVYLLLMLALRGANWRGFRRLAAFGMSALVGFAIAAPQLGLFLEGLREGYTIHQPGAYSGGGTSPLNLTLPLWPYLLGQLMTPWDPSLFPNRVNWEGFPLVIGGFGLLLFCLLVAQIGAEARQQAARVRGGGWALAALSLLLAGMIVALAGGGAIRYLAVGACIAGGVVSLLRTGSYARWWERPRPGPGAAWAIGAAGILATGLVLGTTIGLNALWTTRVAELVPRSFVVAATSVVALVALLGAAGRAGLWQRSMWSGGGACALGALGLLLLCIAIGVRAPPPARYLALSACATGSLACLLCAGQQAGWWRRAGPRAGVTWAYAALTALGMTVLIAGSLVLPPLLEVPVGGAFRVTLVTGASVGAALSALYWAGVAAAFWPRPGCRAAGLGAMLLLAGGILSVILSGTIAYSPIWSLPILDQINFPRYVSPLLALSLATLVAWGMTGVARLSRRRLLAANLLLLAASLLGALVVGPHVLGGVSSAVDHNYWLASIGLGVLPFVIVVAAIDVVLIALLRGRTGLPRAQAALILCVVAQSVFFVRYGLDVQDDMLRLLLLLVAAASAVLLALRSGRLAFLVTAAVSVATMVIIVAAPHRLPSTWDPFSPAPPFIQFLQERLGAGSKEGRVLTTEGVMVPNEATRFGVAELASLNPVQIDTTARYLSQMLSREPVSYLLPIAWRGMAPNALDWPDYFARRQYFNVLGVRYLVDAPTGPLSQQADDDLAVVYQDGRVSIYEDLRAFPRAFVLHQFREVPDLRTALCQLGPSLEVPRLVDAFGYAGALAAPPLPRLTRSYVPLLLVAQPDTGDVVEVWQGPGGQQYQAPHCASGPPIDLRAAAVVERDAAEGPASARPAAGREFSAQTITHYEPDRVEIESRLDEPGLLVLSDAYYPGWKALVDGQPRAVYRVNGTVRGVFVEAGVHQVSFRYEPDGLPAWLLMSAVSSLAALVLLLWSCLPWGLGRWSTRPRPERGAPPGATTLHHH